MRILDQEGNEITSEINYDLGHTEYGKVLVAHHDAVQYQEAVYEDVKVAEYENGGQLYEHRLVTPAVEAVDAWDEYEDVLVYIPYTEEELSERAKQKEEQEKAHKEAEEAQKELEEKNKKREQFLDSADDRVTALEQSQTDTDEAIVSLYEALTSVTSD